MKRHIGGSDLNPWAQREHTSGDEKARQSGGSDSIVPKLGPWIISEAV